MKRIYRMSRSATLVIHHSRDLGAISTWDDDFVKNMT